jgi:SAM-dependent methyltransferase
VFSTSGGVLQLLPADARSDSYSDFYNAPDPERYGRRAMPDTMVHDVEAFASDAAHDAVVLEIGSGGGAFDSLHPGYVASDLSLYALKRFSTGVRVQADARALPFRDGSVDRVISVATLEHIPDPAAALAEIDRCLSPHGRAFLFPAWYVRPWASKGLHVRPFSDLGRLDRIRKATLPVRDSRGFWFAKVFPHRLYREVALALAGRKLEFSYRSLDPNLSEFLASDSDAFSSMDPQAVAAYFLSRAYRDLRRSSAIRRLFYAYEPVIVSKPAAGDQSGSSRH